jgi:hypothetical protein
MVVLSSPFDSLWLAQGKLRGVEGSRGAITRQLQRNSSTSLGMTARIREGPDAFGTIAAAVRSEDTALVPSTLADNASSPPRRTRNQR